MMISIIEDLLPASYYSSNLWGAQADQLVLHSLMTSVLPELAAVLSQHNIDLSLIICIEALTSRTDTVATRLTLKLESMFGR